MSELEKLLSSCLFEIGSCDNLKKLEEVKIIILGKNGQINDLTKKIRELDDEQKRKLGTEINHIKNTVSEHWNAKFSELKAKEIERKIESEFIDISMPSRPYSQGKIHPLTKVTEEISNILSSYGFMFADGPDIENEYYNFTTMNIPEHHPARTMHDTFYVNMFADECGRKLLRTHTSPVQNHSMTSHAAPFRFFSIGRVYRSDYDATHTPMFSQIEGIMVDKGVGFSHLKWLLSDFLKKFFKVSELSVRFRPSFFPFTEPSAEVDVNYGIENGKIVFGAGNKWLEICGCGVIHPNVLKYGNVDAEKYQGIAFGFGLERLASLKYGIPDLRGYFESNDRWRDTFGFNHSVR